MTKVATEINWFDGHQMEPITEDLSLLEQNMFFIDLFVYGFSSHSIIFNSYEYITMKECNFWLKLGTDGLWA